MSRCLTAEKVQLMLKSELQPKVAVGTALRCGLLRIGEDPADVAYEQSLVRQFPQYGITPVLENLPANATIGEVQAVLTEWNEAPEIKGILPLLPFPGQLGYDLNLAPQKDIDGVVGHRYFYPCTPQAVMAYLKAYGIPLKGRKAVVLGRSPRVGKPLAELLQQAGAEVAVVHSQTPEPSKVIRTGDLVFAAVGKPRFLKETLLREGQTVIDIGINPDPEHPGKICGDLDENCIEKLNLTYTPVPGGIGSVTTLVLISHVLTTP